MGEANEWEWGKQYFAQTEVGNVLAQQLFSATPVSQGKLPKEKQKLIQVNILLWESEEETRMESKQIHPFSDCVPEILLLILSSAQGNNHQWHLPHFV